MLANFDVDILMEMIFTDSFTKRIWSSSRWMGQIAWEQQLQINGCFIRLAENKYYLKVK